MKKFSLVLLSALICAGMASAESWNYGTSNVTVDLSVLGEDEDIIIYGDFYENNPSNILGNDLTAKNTTKTEVKGKAVSSKNTKKSQKKIVLKKPKPRKIVLKKPEPKTAEPLVLVSPKDDTLPLENGSAIIKVPVLAMNGSGVENDVSKVNSQNLLARGPVRSVNNRLMFDFNVDVATRPETMSNSVDHKGKMTSAGSEWLSVTTVNRNSEGNVTPFDERQKGEVKPQNERVALQKNVNKTYTKAGADVKTDAEQYDPLRPKAAKTEMVAVNDLNDGSTPDNLVKQRMISKPHILNADMQKIIAENGGNVLVFDFDEGNAQIADEVKSRLQVLADALNNDPEAKVRLISYAKGGENYSTEARKMSLERAINMRNTLVEAGASSAQVEVRALGNRVSKDVIFMEIIME